MNSSQKKEQAFTIKHWNEEDRPREKLLHKGKTSLTDAELMAILIGSGNRNESAVGLCKRILASVKNNLNDLGKLSLAQLVEFPGIGEAKAITILAAIELGKRRKLEEIPEKSKIENSKDVFNLLQPYLGELPHEEFWILYLNNAHKVLQKKQTSIGGITGTLVDIRLVLKNALEIGATSIILVHNHPSGSLAISNEDKKLTQKIKDAAETVEIKVLDHIIITESSYFSFADEGIL